MEGRPPCRPSFKHGRDRACPSTAMRSPRTSVALAFLVLALFILFPTDLASLVLVLQPSHQRLEIINHRASREIFARRLLQDFAPIFRASLFQNVFKPRADFLVPGVVTGLRRLME